MPDFKELSNIFSPVTLKWFTDTFNQPTDIQMAAWPAIAAGRDVLVSAPTGTGKTLSAFLIFIDRLKKLEREGELQKELYLIYISPLKALASDIRENLKRPLDGISALEEDFYGNLKVSIRTGDTPQSERRAMIKAPPHILITTPESLFLMLTSASGKKILNTAKAIIIDELHAMIDSKRGAHLMLSLARLDKLCPSPLQRIGLSATIKPLETATKYLSPREVVVAAPKMSKKIEIAVVSPYEGSEGMKPTIWEDMGQTVYKYCNGKNSVIAFLEGRAMAEKLAYYVNQLGGEGFARTHHGSLSKEQRHEVELALRQGQLRLLCATSSMELGIDVGDIDQVLQVGCPATISGTMQRLGRAGHNPGRTSVMYIFPRTAFEGLYCGLTAETVLTGGIESCHPPMQCLDILAQHLVSMAVDDGYTVDDVMELLRGTYQYKSITREDVTDVLAMLAGDFEHNNDIPVRPRILYDRIHETVSGDSYSRMLAISSGGTIPDKGMYACKTEKGIKVGELDEEFVYESKVGDKFMLGTFAWQIMDIKKDAVTVAPASKSGARLPFWKNEWRGRGIETGLRFGQMLRKLNDAHKIDKNAVMTELYNLHLDEISAKSVGNFIKRQFVYTGLLPDDKNIIIEHFKDSDGNYQIMFHSIFGRQVNAPIAALVQETVERSIGVSVSCVEADEGFLLYANDGSDLPKGIFDKAMYDNIEQLLETLLPAMPVFSFVFRYNISHALMMGVRKMGRLPLWLQRIRSAETLSMIINHPTHPIIRETKRECLEDLWDIGAARMILDRIKSEQITVHEVETESASPMSMPFQWNIIGQNMYDYTPVTKKVRGEVAKEMLKATSMLSPTPENLGKVSERTKLPTTSGDLHTLLMIEGDLAAGELEIPAMWLEELIRSGRAAYLELGLWIAAEQLEEYTQAFEENNQNLQTRIIRRLLRYRGAKSIEEISSRYQIDNEKCEELLIQLAASESVVYNKNDGLYYHAELYKRAVTETIKHRREVSTLPAENYAALLSSGIKNKSLNDIISFLADKFTPADTLECSLFPSRVAGYSNQMLDAFLAEGKYFWQMQNGQIIFHSYDDIDWDSEVEIKADLTENEKIVYDALLKRGASFMQGLSRLIGGISPHETLLSLVSKGLVTADNFIPIRQLLNSQRNNAPIKARINARVNALTSGRFEAVRNVTEPSTESKLKRILSDYYILSKETVGDIPWSQALETLRVWEYTGQIRRGYYIEGLSGAQFIDGNAYENVINRLQNPNMDIIWISASDPLQPWGKILPHETGKGFSNISATALCLKGGVIIAAFERNGQVLKVYDKSLLSEALMQFKADYKNKRIYQNRGNITVKEYPSDAVEVLKAAGFSMQLLDFVLYPTSL